MQYDVPEQFPSFRCFLTACEEIFASSTKNLNNSIGKKRRSANKKSGKVVTLKARRENRAQIVL